jgi:crotonobetainyl-CoA:carnitine CoA-transferase CaiB-like acyl-CoA transferase
VAAGGPLQGVRVLSLAQQLPGPYCGMLLGDLGAEVTMVEQVPAGDPARAFPSLFEMVNRGKRSVAIDLKRPDGRTVLHRLVRRADVVLEGFRPGVAGRLGADYETLAGLRPGLVYCAISGYGQDGPAVHDPGHDLSYQGRAGAVAVRDGEVVENSLPVADLSAAMFAAIGVLAALVERDVSGGGRRGRYIDVSMAESVLSWNSIAIGAALAPGTPSVGGAGREPAYGAFRAADGWLTLSIAHEDHFWRALCEVLGAVDLAGLAGPARRARATELRAWVAARLAEAPVAHWLAVLPAAGVPAGPLNRPEDTLADPLFQARDAFARLDGHVYVRPPLRLDGQVPPIEAAAPMVGEHTAECLAEAGVSDDDVARMVEDGSVVVADRRAAACDGERV